MDDRGQIYFDSEDKIPDADKKRLEDAEELARLRADARAAAEQFADAVAAEIEEGEKCRLEAEIEDNLQHGRD